MAVEAAVITVVVGAVAQTQQTQVAAVVVGQVTSSRAQPTFTSRELRRRGVTARSSLVGTERRNEPRLESGRA